MQLAPVKSSLISHIGHDPVTNTLHVVFPNGGHYTYANFTEDDFTKFRDAQADSLGKYFLKHIKGNAAHPFTKVRVIADPNGGL